MLELIEVFSPAQILACILGLILAIKGGWDLIDFFKNKYSEKFNSDYNRKTKEEKLEDHYKKCSAQYQEYTQMYNSLEKKIDSLIEHIEAENANINNKLNILSDSNRNGIKAWLVNMYHTSKKDGFLDDFAQDLIEKRFEDYKKLGGNSYISRLVDEMRELPSEEEYKKV